MDRGDTPGVPASTGRVSDPPRPRNTDDLRDVSLAEAARIIGVSQNTLRPIWDQIPTAYIAPSGRYYVAIWGLRAWQRTRGKAP